ncbi:hypothetical protein JOB18_027882 [Solea senegalensis]|uniref:Uncharacterized protein n=1 Tax=Solea senegalensis TaxID=28829 RepID=A0AAV6RZR5_SOLSE|nr:hypothetical protein JOB18_027882 [Solea senegalensis]
MSGTTVSISTAPQNRPQSPPTGVTVALQPMCTWGMGLLHPTVTPALDSITSRTLFTLSGVLKNIYFDFSALVAHQPSTPATKEAPGPGYQDVEPSRAEPSRKCPKADTEGGLSFSTHRKRPRQSLSTE